MWWHSCNLDLSERGHLPSDLQEQHRTKRNSTGSLSEFGLPEIPASEPLAQQPRRKKEPLSLSLTAPPTRPFAAVLLRGDGLLIKRAHRDPFLEQMEGRELRSSVLTMRREQKTFEMVCAWKASDGPPPVVHMKKWKDASSARPRRCLSEPRGLSAPQSRSGPSSTDSNTSRAGSAPSRSNNPGH